MTTNIVVLAAGVGSRLGRPHPKPLTPLADGETILGRALRLLTSRFQRHSVNIVVGFKKEMIMEEVPDVGFIYNQAYGDTNTSKSLLKALTILGPGGVLWLNGDVVFDEGVLDDVLPYIATDRSFVCVNTASVAEEEVKYTVDADGYIKSLSKDIASGARGRRSGSTSSPPTTAHSSRGGSRSARTRTTSSGASSWRSRRTGCGSKRSTSLTGPSSRSTSPRISPA